MGSIAFSPLAQGLLTDKYINGIPKESRAAGKSVFLNEDAITDELIKKIVALNKVASSRNQTLAQMALVWALTTGELTSVLVGASRIEQIQNNVKILDNMVLREEELQLIDNILNN